MIAGYVITVILSVACGVLLGLIAARQCNPSTLYLQQLTAEHLKRFDDLTDFDNDVYEWADGAHDLLEQWLYHTRINTTQETK